jgi:hypothetical protein
MCSSTHFLLFPFFYHGQIHAFYEMTHGMIENILERNQFSSCLDAHQELNFGARAIAYVPVLASFGGRDERHGQTGSKARRGRAGPGTGSGGG